VGVAGGEGGEGAVVLGVADDAVVVVGVHVVEDARFGRRWGCAAYGAWRCAWCGHGVMWCGENRSDYSQGHCIGDGAISEVGHWNANVIA